VVGAASAASLVTGVLSATLAGPGPVPPAASPEVAAASVEPLAAVVLVLVVSLVAGVLSATLAGPGPVPSAASVEPLAAALVLVASGAWLAPVASVVWLAPVAPAAAPRERPTAPRMGTRTDVRDAEIPIARGATNSPA
jgi:hypothetical protein